jgi:hypothetical protein
MTKIYLKPEIHTHWIDPKRTVKRLGPYFADTGFVVDRSMWIFGLQLVWFGIRLELHWIPKKDS